MTIRSPFGDPVPHYAIAQYTGRLLMTEAMHCSGCEVRILDFQGPSYDLDDFADPHGRSYLGNLIRVDDACNDDFGFDEEAGLPLCVNCLENKMLI